MTLTFGTIVSLAWPFVIAGAAWGIAVWALHQTDECSLVKRLTTSPRGGPRALRSAPGDRSSDTRLNNVMETTEV